MYVNYKLEIEDAMIVITEVEYNQRQGKNHYQEEIPEHITIEAGYAIGFDGRDRDIDYFLEEYKFYIHDEVMKKFKLEGI